MKKLLKKADPEIRSYYRPRATKVNTQFAQLAARPRQFDAVAYRAALEVLG